MTPKQLWIKALRSGKYKQTTLKLLREDGSCCALGVACLVYEEHVKPLTKKLVADFYTFSPYDNILPSEVQEWLGCDGGCNLNGQPPVYSLNDDGKTFEEIADILENSEFRK